MNNDIINFYDVKDVKKKAHKYNNPNFNKTNSRNTTSERSTKLLKIGVSNSSIGL